MKSAFITLKKYIILQYTDKLQLITGKYPLCNS